MYGDINTITGSSARAQQSLKMSISVLFPLASIAFRHPPPNSARFGYGTEGVLFISAAADPRPPKGSVL